MVAGEDLSAALVRPLSRCPGPLLAIGDADTLSRLVERLPQVTAMLPDSVPPLRRTHSHQLEKAFRGDPLMLPFARASLDGLIAVGVLSRLPDPSAVLAAWTDHLRPGAWLVTAELLIRSATVRHLRRLLGGPRFARAPEEITGLLLNAGFGEIGQCLASGPAPVVVTSGQWRDLAP